MQPSTSRYRVVRWVHAYGLTCGYSMQDSLAYELSNTDRLVSAEAFRFGLHGAVRAWCGLEVDIARSQFVKGWPFDANTDAGKLSSHKAYTDLPTLLAHIPHYGSELIFLAPTYKAMYIKTLSTVEVKPL